MFIIEFSKSEENSNTFVTICACFTLTGKGNISEETGKPDCKGVLHPTGNFQLPMVSYL